MTSLGSGTPRGDARTWRTVLPRIAAAVPKIIFLGLTEVYASVNPSPFPCSTVSRGSRIYLLYLRPLPGAPPPHPLTPPHRPMDPDRLSLVSTASLKRIELNGIGHELHA
jgi:hypothetical protein